MSCKKAVLRHMYKDLVGDSSAAATTSQEEVDERVAAFFEVEEPDLVFDLREAYSGNSSKFDLFWRKAEEFLEEDVGTAVDDRRHSQVIHLAKAISVRDFREQVKQNVLRTRLFHQKHTFVCNSYLQGRRRRQQKGTQGDFR